MRPVTTATTRDDDRADARRQLAAATDLISSYTMLTVRQRRTILEALNAADWQIALQHAEAKHAEAKRLERHPELSDYLEAAHGLICNAHRTTVDHVTEADGASPGWAEAARRWIDAYPPKLTHDGYTEFAAEVARIRERNIRAAHALELGRVTDARDRAEQLLAEARAEAEQHAAAVIAERAITEVAIAQRDQAYGILGRLVEHHTGPVLAFNTPECITRDQARRDAWADARDLFGVRDPFAVDDLVDDGPELTRPVWVP